VDCLLPLNSDVSSLRIIEYISNSFYVPSEYLGSNEDSWDESPHTCSASP